MSGHLKNILPHFLVFIGFIVVSLAYFYPVLQGKEIFQSDIVQYIGMSREQSDFRAKTGEEPYWTDAAFGGMPTYQLGAHYPHNYIKKIDSALRFLPRPSDYLFLYFIGFYILLLVLKLDYKLAFLGALAFGFSTYLIVILGVGHNAKAHAIAYMPWVLGGILLCFRQKYIVGFLLLAFGMALEIGANHFQMTYYLLLMVIVLGIVYLINAYKRKRLPQFFKSLGVMVVAVVLAVAANATNLLATQEYAEFSTRGESELTISAPGQTSNPDGLGFDYITRYSYGIMETFNLFIPRFMGGSNAEALGRDSHVYGALIKIGASPVQAAQFANSAPTYWGNQPYVAAPAYIGASVIFLFIFALYLVKGRLKWWIIGGALLALLLSWGKNFAFLTQFFIDFVPLYNKFRAVSSIQVIIELCLPIMAVVGLSKLFFSKTSEEAKWHALKWATYISGGICLVFLLFKSALFNFSGASDGVLIQQLGIEFVNALKEDRKAVFTADTLRSLIIVLIAAGIVWAFLKKKLSRNLSISLLVVLVLFDLVGIAKRYVNAEDFVKPLAMEVPFQPNSADLQIMKDTTHYRVLDLSVSPFNSARTSYFHNSIGGYHAAKPQRMQDLFEFYISRNKMEVLNMLNTKYFIVPTENGEVAQKNPDTNGNAWFVEDVQLVESANEALLALEGIDTEKTAIVRKNNRELLKDLNFPKDSVSSIKLKSYRANKLVYQYNVPTQKLAVFSEIYYPYGWQAYIDGKKAPHFRADYTLRAMILPPGKHQITFKFEPQVVKTGSTIALLSSIILGLLLLGGIGMGIKKRRDTKNEEA